MTEPTITINDLLAVIRKLPTDQFALFEAGIHAESERRREIKRSQARAFLEIGDQVTFDAKTRGVKTGKLIKVNLKTAKVSVKEARYLGGPTVAVTWTVPLSILKKAA